VELITGTGSCKVLPTDLTKDEWIALILWAINQINPVRKYLEGAQSMWTQMVELACYEAPKLVSAFSGSLYDGSIRCIVLYSQKFSRRRIFLGTAMQISFVLTHTDRGDYLVQPFVDCSVEAWQQFDLDVLSGVFGSLIAIMSDTSEKKMKHARACADRAISLRQVAQNIGLGN